jgi:hypothetical protein
MKKIVSSMAIIALVLGTVSCSKEKETESPQPTIPTTPVTPTPAGQEQGLYLSGTKTTINAVYLLPPSYTGEDYYGFVVAGTGLFYDSQTGDPTGLGDLFDFACYQTTLTGQVPTGTFNFDASATGNDFTFEESSYYEDFNASTSTSVSEHNLTGGSIVISTTDNITYKIVLNNPTTATGTVVDVLYEGPITVVQ